MGKSLRLIIWLLAAWGAASPALSENSRPIFGEVLAVASTRAAHPEKIRYSPLDLQDGSQLTLVTPESWAPLLDKLAAPIIQTHQSFKKLFGSIPVMDTSIHLMDKESFFDTTGAPRWTNALYFHGQILIPLVPSMAVDFNTLSRSIRHEYTHAVIHAYSNGRCPGWLDEGLAEWAEGTEDGSLRRILKTWLREHPPLKLSLLQGGFTKLDAEMVPVAYAESLFAADHVIKIFGFKAIRDYFSALHSGMPRETAFRRAFAISENAFEAQLKKEMSNFASLSGQKMR